MSNVGEAPAHHPRRACACARSSCSAARASAVYAGRFAQPGSAVSGLPGLLGAARDFASSAPTNRGAVLRMDVPEALLSPFGTVHGGVIATLFDTGLAVAVARRLDPEDRIATHNLNVTYVAFTRERVLRCRAPGGEPAPHRRGRRRATSSQPTAPSSRRRSAPSACAGCAARPPPASASYPRARVRSERPGRCSAGTTGAPRPRRPGRRR